MYKKMKWPFLCMALFCMMGITDIYAQSTPKNPPVIYNLIRGNWNNAMNPDGCVVLDGNDKLTILVRISVGTNQLSSFTALYYKTQFQNGPITIEGPILASALVPETLENDCPVYTFVKEVFDDAFTAECLQNSGNPFSFDYHISLVDEFGNPYPIEDNMELLNTCQYTNDTGEPGIIPSLDYSGTKDLCCPGVVVGGEGYVVSTSTGFTIQEDRAAIHATDEEADLELIIPANSRALAAPVMEAFPNPFQETLAIRFQAKANTKTTIQIWNSNGQLVDQQEVETSFTGTEELNLPTDHLIPDIYFCQLKNEEWSQIVKVIKLQR